MVDIEKIRADNLRKLMKRLSKSESTAAKRALELVDDAYSRWEIWGTKVQFKRDLEKMVGNTCSEKKGK